MVGCRYLEMLPADIRISKRLLDLTPALIVVHLLTYKTATTVISTRNATLKREQLISKEAQAGPGWPIIL